MRETWTAALDRYEFLREQQRTAWGVLATPVRLVSSLRNAVAFSRLERRAPTPRTPYEILLRDPVFRLRRYAAASPRRARPALLLVPPLMLTAEIYDITAEGSAVARLRERGIDPWVVDFGAPERQQGGLRRTLADHVLAVSRAIDRVRACTGPTPIWADTRKAGCSPT